MFSSTFTSCLLVHQTYFKRSWLNLFFCELKPDNHAKFQRLDWTDAAIACPLCWKSCHQIDLAVDWKKRWPAERNANKSLPKKSQFNFTDERWRWRQIRFPLDYDHLHIHLCSIRCFAGTHEYLAISAWSMQELTFVSPGEKRGGKRAFTQRLQFDQMQNLLNPIFSRLLLFIFFACPSPSNEKEFHTFGRYAIKTELRKKPAIVAMGEHTTRRSRREIRNVTSMCSQLKQ